MFNKERAYEIPEGLIINQNDGGSLIEGPFITGGPGSPVGLDLPVSTCYIQNIGTGIIVWKKINTGVNDWREYDGKDLPFDPTGYLNLDPTDTTIEKTIQRLGNQSFDDVTEAEGFTSDATEQTAADGWVSKTGFPWTTTEVKTAGLFSLRWFAEVGQTKATRNFGFRILWRPTGGVWAPISELADQAVSKDNNRIQQSGFKQVSLLTDNTIEIDIQHGQTTQGFESIISNVSVEVRRIGENGA